MGSATISLFMIQHSHATSSKTRVDAGGEVYHVLNHANVRVQIFDFE